MPTQLFGFASLIPFDQLEEIFVGLAGEVFTFFKKDPRSTITTVTQSETTAVYADHWRRHALRNDTIQIEIFQLASYHDNSMTAEWLYSLNQSIQCSPDAAYALRLFINSLSMPAASKLFYEVNPAHQAFADHYLARFAAVTTKKNQ